MDESEFDDGLLEPDALEPEFAQGQPKPAKFAIEEIIGAGDVSKHLTNGQIDEIITDCVEGYERDQVSRSEWSSSYDKGKKALFADGAPKSTPHDNASNARYPLLLDAVVQFGARVNKGFVKGDRIAQPGVIGYDPDGSKRKRAERVTKYISMQALELSTAWKSEHKKLLYNLPLAGTAFKKVTWDSTRNVWRSRFVPAENVVFDNTTADFGELPRLAHEVKKYPYQIEESMRSGFYRRVDVSLQDDEDSQAPQDILECHLLFDLDGDGYPEPYVATIHKETRTLLRFEANYAGPDITRGVRSEMQMQQVPALDPTTGQMVMTVQPVQIQVPGDVVKVQRRDYFVPFHFLPDPKGGFLGMGFAQMLGATQDVIDTLLNQLIDAGTLANSGGGFIGRGVTFRERGPIRFTPGEYKPVDSTGPDLRSSIVPMEFPGASPALFQLMGLMIDTGKSTSSVTDVLTGSVERNMQPTTVMMLVEQGLQVFGDVVEGVFDSMAHELKLAYELNAIYLPDEVYLSTLDAPQEDMQGVSARTDFAADMAVRPVGDPKAITDVQRLVKAEYLKSFLGQPGIDNREIQMRLLEAGGIDNAEKVLPPQQGPGPQEMAAMAMAKLQAQQATAEVVKTLSEAMKNVATAEAAEAGPQMQYYASLIQALAPMMMQQGASNGGFAPQGLPDQGGIPSMASGPGMALSPPGLGAMASGPAGPGAPLGLPNGGPGGPVGIGSPQGPIAAPQ